MHLLAMECEAIVLELNLGYVAMITLPWQTPLALIKVVYDPVFEVLAT